MCLGPIKSSILYRNLTVMDMRGIPFSLDRVVLETLEALRDAALRLGQAHKIAICRWDGREDTRPKLPPITKPLIVVDAVSARPDITVRLTDEFDTALSIAKGRAAPVNAATR